MKKIFNKIKAILTTIWIVLISLPFKIFGQDFEWGGSYIQPAYAAPPLEPTPGENFTMIIKNFSIPIIFIFGIIFGIISFVKIRKIDDKTLRKKKIKNTVIIISILILLIILLIFTPSIIEYFS